jgi:23S rRNA (cytosine1962-C5)-methyltransferase
MQPIRLKGGEGKRLKNGHLWLFSNEVDTKITPLTQFEPGELVRVEDAAGQALGTGYVNPGALISGRLLTRNAGEVVDVAFFRRRFEAALSLRQALHGAPYYRLAHGESDFLPGLVVDRYGDALVIQAGTAGMERRLDEIVEALQSLLRPSSILLKNDAGVRELEGLERYVRPAHGAPPEEVEVEEDGLRFVAPLLSGQKTGYYYDMRENRARAANLARGLAKENSAVLDAFCYVGVAGVRAALAGARRVVCVDSSEKALGYAQENARRNGVADRVEIVRAEAMGYLAAQPAKSFGLAIVDPPAFIKRKKDIPTGRQAYKKLNGLAVRLVSDWGFLACASCSQHLAADELLWAVRQGAARQNAELQLLWRGGQAPDHPVHPAMPETDYLKALCCRVVRGG